jgi:hypothetical protein
METGKSKLLASVLVAVTTVGDKVVISSANAKDVLKKESTIKRIIIKTEAIY